MAYIAVDGIRQINSGADLSVSAASGNVIMKLGDDAGVESFSVKDSLDALKTTIDSDGNVRVYGNLTIDGSTQIIKSTSVWFGDSEITLNSQITGSAGNKYGGIAVKRVGEIAGVTATAFTNSTGVITCGDCTSFLAAGDIFYVVNSSKNNGLFEVDSLDSSSITINSSSTVPGTKLSLVDETGATASINEAIHSFVQWNSSNYWEFGYYNAGAVRKAYKSVGVGSGGAAAFSNSNPDILAEGTTNANSSAANFGVYDDFTNSTSTTLQAVLKDFDTAIGSMGGLTGGTPNLTYDTTNSAGVAATTILTDATWAIFDTNNPAAITAGGTGSTGSAAFAARRDHRHAAAVGTPVDIGAANDSGSGPNFVKSDHVHALVANGAALKFGSENIGSGNSTVAVSFGTAFGTACTTVVVDIINTTDVSPYQFTAVNTAKSTSGFTATLSGAVDSANYKCNWYALGY